MDMKFEGVLFAVRSMAVSRPFYENVLGRRVAMDLGTNLVFEGGPVLQEGFAALAGFPEENTVYRAYNSEIYFETDDLDAEAERLRAAGVELLHEIKEYPWASGCCASSTPTATSSSWGRTCASWCCASWRRA